MKKRIIALSLISMLVLASCGTKKDNSQQSSTSATTAPQTTAATTAETTTEATTEHVTAAQNEVGFEGMTEVNIKELNMGNYNVSVDSSSSMFKIAGCILHVSDHDMIADIIIDSKSYDALYMGTEDEAKNAAESDRITYTTNEKGQSVFTVPVEALDKEIQCAALSAKKQEWYGRTLVFRADSLPDTAFKEARYATAESLKLEDGEYNIDVKLEGGSGKASVESPAKLTVKDGKATAKIVWSSDKYDEMVVNYLEYTPEIADGHSVFEIPVGGFDYRMHIEAETTAMSEPHMIEYTLYFDSATIKK
ncbi:hypothetical protein [Ruminococcus flavefaciens]|uniref:Iron Transport-associated domain-containing protein n=1 Tax=Ruminococcus flavefaciens TaxID=1265 RepID=A0A1K1NJH1_RUMFL|nr:hypothetical protein [Ruminococcus flavefaciens]SFW35409.1 hypothetical protein SAMN02910280_2061 [Ruminococcus flavefaciens]